MNIKLFFLIPIFSILFFASTQAQTIEVFERDFEKGIACNFDEKWMNNFEQKYEEILSEHTPASIYLAPEYGVEKYLLESIKDKKHYQKGIKKLLKSSNFKHRLLAYCMIANAGDLTYEKVLVNGLKDENKKRDEKTLIAFSLAFLEIKDAAPLFDFLVANPHTSDYFGMAYLNLPPDVLERAAYRRMDNDNIFAKELVVASLIKAPLNAKNEAIIREALEASEETVFRMGVNAAARHRLGNLLEKLKPRLEYDEERMSALNQQIYTALAASPTPQDHNYFMQQMELTATPSRVFLHICVRSQNPKMVRYWLNYITTEEKASRYSISYFAEHGEEHILTTTLSSELRAAIPKAKNKTLQGKLIKLLGKNDDDATIEFFIQLLNDDDLSLQTGAIKALSENNNPKILAAITKKVDDAVLLPAVIDWMVENNVDGYQNKIIAIYNTKEAALEKRNAIEYLAAFPNAASQAIFRKVLNENKHENNRIQKDIVRFAVVGSGKLKDKEMVDTLMHMCQNIEDEHSLLKYELLNALLQIQEPSTKSFIETYKNDRSKYIRTLVQNGLANWKS